MEIIIIIIIIKGILIHRDPIKMHPFCLGLYFTNWSIKMKFYLIITINRVLSFIGETLIRLGVLEKSRVFKKEWILPHSNGICYSNSHVFIYNGPGCMSWSVLGPIVLTTGTTNSILEQNPFQESNYKTTKKITVRIYLIHLMVWPVVETDFFPGASRGKMRFWGGKNPKICRK